MSTKIEMSTIIELQLIESEILNIIENIDDLTQSDLQGCIQAQLLNAYNLGVKETEKRDEIIINELESQII